MAAADLDESLRLVITSYDYPLAFLPASIEKQTVSGGADQLAKRRKIGRCTRAMDHPVAIGA
jgi:hypothetical protein